MRRNLADLDRNTWSPLGRLLQEAMAHGITNDMIYGGLMTGQTALQGILADPVAIQNCLIGTRRVALDGKVYRYASASGNCSTEELAYSVHRLQCLAWSAIVSGTIGDNHLVVTVGGGDGPAAGGVMPEDYLAGGQLLITNFPGLFRSITSTIISNTGCAGTGPITITIADTLPVTLLAGTQVVEAMGSIYRLVNAVVNCPADASAIGRATSFATAALPYHWQQTWGPCFLVPNNGNNTLDVGNSNFNNAVVMWNGTIGTHEEDQAQSEHNQHVGFVLSRANAGTTQGAPFIMLQISP